MSNCYICQAALPSRRHWKYRIQDCCARCEHAFVRDDYDEPSQYFCTHGAFERPLCGSIAMDEGFCFDDEETYRQQEHRWVHWSEPRRVKPWGWCPDFTYREEAAD